MALPLWYQPPILPFQYLSLVPGDTSHYYIICAYLKCKLNAFSTWVYISITIKPYPPPCPFSIFIQQFFASIIELFNPFFSTSVVDHLLNNIIRLISSPTSNPYGINPASSIWTFSKASWKNSSVFIIPVCSPSLW